MKKAYPKFYGRVVEKDGHNNFVPDNEDYYQKYMDLNTKAGQRYTFALLPYRKPRTTGSAANIDEGKGNQNGYYWAVVVPMLAMHFGFELWQMHEELKLIFMPQASKLSPDKVIGGTTQKLNRMQWEDLMERMRVWALVEHEVKIPKPNEAVTDDEEDNDRPEDDEDEEPEKPLKTPGIIAKEADPINPLIELFKDVNPSYARLYPNKNQRAAMQRLLKQYSPELLGRIIKYLPTSNAAKFAPTITTPMQLETDLGKLIAWGHKQKAAKRKTAKL